MDYPAVEALRERHPAWRLLRAGNAALILSFLGRYFVEAAVNRDYNIVMGVTLVYGTLLMVLNALVDVAYTWLDPRVKLS